ncbi:MAG: hypothetical protein A2622_03275 [Bdellovibrionales bacterium RIFCSPHIGHO2_01_FULL_40_29]|nr:MAG: hypothetical protein A2622_03275 [Bdellovibrionales bacterium RIFCSPHIGHO2_01_FULL_40_29]OFZ34091.1 MAG: hypothetical protein A3D17_03695 [Bdellovibrionales bacterium RIFCSPHIGHO2_02_FULL_40_15]
MVIQSFINNQFQKNLVSFQKTNPFNAESLHQVESCDLMQLVNAIQGSQKAFSEWKDSVISDRIQLLKSIKEKIDENELQWAQDEALDQGLPTEFVLQHGVRAASHSFEVAISELVNRVVDNKTEYSAVGVISLISSWNLSLRVICERLAPALAAGNSVIIKVSSQSPVTAVTLARILQAVSAPQGLIQVIVTDQQDVKNLLVTHPGIRAVSFVGHLKNASDILLKISGQAFNQFKKIQIATGSKNSAVALGSPDEVNFAEVMNSFLVGQGQLAWNSNRLFILEKYELAWVERIENFLSQLTPATSIQDASLWGPCIRSESFTHFQEIETMAVRDQAKLIQTKSELTELQKKCFLRPTFTKDMSNCSTLQQDQVMAPLFILSVVKYGFDIAKYSNVSYYGQSAHIWAEESKIAKIASQLDVAQVFQNKWSVQHHQPSKGVKQSGFGIQDYRVFGDFFSNVKILA